MKRGGDPVIVAILAEIEAVDQTLVRLRVPTSAHDDLRQEVTWMAWREALRGRVAWWHPPSLRGFLRVSTARMVFAWWAAHPRHDELRDDDAASELDPERLIIAIGMLRFMREATSPERWRALRAHALGVPASDVARRERVPRATIYDRIRRAREDVRAALARDDAAIYVRRKK